MALVYFADDDFDARSLVRGCLSLDGHNVKCFETGEALLGEFLNNRCDLVILDVMMPRVDGFEILRRIRGFSSVPVILLTAKNGEGDYFSGFAKGADDYIEKPFRPILLRGKVHELLSRIQLSASEKTVASRLKNMTCVDLRFSGNNTTFYINDRHFRLTPVEGKYLHFMMERFNTPVAREDILKGVWGLEKSSSRVVDETNRRIRIKLTEEGAHVVLESIWGYGYILKEKE